MSINHRTYQGQADDQPIRDLLSQHYAATRHPYHSVDPPNWERISAAIRLGPDGPGIHLWELEPPLPMPVGLLLLQINQGEFSCLVHPDYGEIQVAIYDWVETEVRAAQAEQGLTTLLRCSVCEGNRVQKAVLSRRGYTKGKLATVFRRRCLDGVGSEMALPEGYRVQEVQALSDELFAERALAESEVLGGAITVQVLRELQESPIYRPELDLVISAPGGRLAAFCTIWFDGHHGIGFHEPIGTVPAHRCRGLGTALMHEGFRRLQELGATLAYLGHSADNRAGSQLYESVGMPVFDREHWWQKAF